MFVYYHTKKSYIIFIKYLQEINKMLWLDLYAWKIKPPLRKSNIKHFIFEFPATLRFFILPKDK